MSQVIDSHISGVQGAVMVGANGGREVENEHFCFGCVMAPLHGPELKGYSK